MKTTLQALITIDPVAWKRVCSLAARQGRSLPVVLGDLLDAASTEPVAEMPKAGEAYQPPPLARLFLRRHTDIRPYQD